MKFFNYLKKYNWALIGPAFIFTFLGLASIYSSSLSRGDFLNFKKQIIFFIFSLSLLFLLKFFDLTFLKNNSFFILGFYLFSFLSLLGLFFWGEEIRGTKTWYKLGPLSFDPTPLAAISLIFVLSRYFAAHHPETKMFQPIFYSFLYLLPLVLLILLQPNFGSSLPLIFIWLGIIVFSGIRLRHFLILNLIGLILFALAWQFWLQDYQKQRILTFLNPKADFQGNAWNINQAKIAIGSGGFWGKGIGNGSQVQYGFLPEPQTDFIFSAIAEEMGFLGVCFLLFGWGFFLWQIIRLSLAADNNFTRLFGIGFNFFLVCQCFVNIGMNLGLLPIVGIPLPFVSYGGSQLLASYLGLGILEALRKE